MAKRLKKIAQPPIDRDGRAAETRGVASGLVLVLLGAGLLGVGLGNSYRVTFDLGPPHSQVTDVIPEHRLVLYATTGIGEKITKAVRAGRPPAAAPESDQRGTAGTTTVRTDTGTRPPSKPVIKAGDDCPT